MPATNHPNEEGLELVLRYLTSVRAWYLATSVDNRPHVRPFSYAAIEDGALRLCTATTKDVWDELEENPWFEATSWWPGHGWLVLRGRVDLRAPVSDEVRRAGFEHLEGLGEHFDGPDDPTLAFPKVEETEAWICDHEQWIPIKL